MVSVSWAGPRLNISKPRCTESDLDGPGWNKSEPSRKCPPMASQSEKCSTPAGRRILISLVWTVTRHGIFCPIILEICSTRLRRLKLPLKFPFLMTFLTNTRRKTQTQSRRDIWGQKANCPSDYHTYRIQGMYHSAGCIPLSGTTNTHRYCQPLEPLWNKMSMEFLSTLWLLPVPYLVDPAWSSRISSNLLAPAANFMAFAKTLSTSVAFLHYLWPRGNSVSSFSPMTNMGFRPSPTARRFPNVKESLVAVLVTSYFSFDPRVISRCEGSEWKEETMQLK